MTPARENLRRSSRAVKRYGNIDPESDGMADSDPDFHLSDSDDDPDFNPVDKKVGSRLEAGAFILFMALEVGQRKTTLHFI